MSAHPPIHPRTTPLPRSRSPPARPPAGESGRGCAGRRHLAHPEPGPGRRRAGPPGGAGEGAVGWVLWGGCCGRCRGRGWGRGGGRADSWLRRPLGRPPAAGRCRPRLISNASPRPPTRPPRAPWPTRAPAASECARRCCLLLRRHVASLCRAATAAAGREATCSLALKHVKWPIRLGLNPALSHPLPLTHPTLHPPPPQVPAGAGGHLGHRLCRLPGGPHLLHHRQARVSGDGAGHPAVGGQPAGHSWPSPLNGTGCCGQWRAAASPAPPGHLQRPLSRFNFLYSGRSGAQSWGHSADVSSRGASCLPGARPPGPGPALLSTPGKARQLPPGHAGPAAVRCALLQGARAQRAAASRCRRQQLHAKCALQ